MCAIIFKEAGKRIISLSVNGDMAENDDNVIKNLLRIENAKDAEEIYKISYALASKDRINIIKSLLQESKTLTELSRELSIPIATVSRHIDILVDADLIFINYQPGPKGHTKHCALSKLSYAVSFAVTRQKNTSRHKYSCELPVGYFSHCHIKAPCGMLDKERKITEFDEPNAFFVPERVEAECLWFNQGFVSYNFPTPPPEVARQFSEIMFSFEICSETNCYNNTWPSDITVFINKKEILTFTSPGDFGGRRGKYTPEFWPITATQFGILKNVVVNKQGVFLDNQFLHSGVTFDDLNLLKGSSVQLSIGIKDDARYKGGLNLFGKNFGDYPQAIKMELSGDEA